MKITKKTKMYMGKASQPVEISDLLESMRIYRKELTRIQESYARGGASSEREEGFMSGAEQGYTSAGEMFDEFFGDLL